MPFTELPHTADWALHVWAADLPSLFCEAARGMNTLAGAVLTQAPRQERAFRASGPDAESLLVAFLSELVYYAEQEHMGFDDFTLELTPEDDGTLWLHANLRGARLAVLNKAIKAVTYHGLKIRQTEQGCEATIVFDV
jgi:SHS2 domain-containing protein